MNIDLSPVINALIALLAAVITAFVIPWLKVRLGNEKLTTLKTWVAVAVSAAEKLYDYSEAGTEKKAYVKKFINDLGLEVDEKILESLIESSVYSLEEKEA